MREDGSMTVRPSPGASTASAAKSARGKYDVVAVGASAGGLKSLFKLLGPLPVAFPASILVVLHLSPEHPSHLAEVLERRLALKVHQARDGHEMSPGTVYVAAPNLHLVAEPSRVRLLGSPLVHYSRPSIDLLFESVAANFGSRAVGIVLSGSGRDGASGIRSIRRAGGATMAEEPSKAEFSAMPYASVATGCVDIVLPLSKLAASLVDLCDLSHG
jgi:two-component system chemotaxis response regulator CheB